MKVIRRQINKRIKYMKLLVKSLYRFEDNVRANKKKTEEHDEDNKDGDINKMNGRKNKVVKRNIYIKEDIKATIKGKIEDEKDRINKVNK